MKESSSIIMTKISKKETNSHMIVSPSVLSLHYDRFNEELGLLNDHAEWIHFDVMDGHFVPNLSFGPDILKTFRRNTDLFLDVHLMVDDPEYFADVFGKAGADSIIFHYEVYNDIERCRELIDRIKNRMYLKAGISIKPNTPAESIEELLKETDIVLVMSVEPGYGGQKFMPEALEKIRFLKEYKEAHRLDYVIEVDGGINDKTAHDALKAGADALVAGSYVFDGDIVNNINKLKNAL